MTTRSVLVLVVLAGCWGKRPARPEPAPAGPPLVGTWADELHTARLRADHLAELEVRRQCPRLPCASSTTSFGTWATAQVELGSGERAVVYRLRLDGADLLELTPPEGEPLRLQRQPALALAGTTWVADQRRWTFTADGFERTEPCDSCAEPIVRVAGTWSFADGTLAIEYEGADESLAVLVEAGGAELVMVGPAETIRYRRAP